MQTCGTDAEVYKNYFLLGFQDFQTGKVTSFEMFDGEKVSPKRLRKLERFLAENRTVGFNTINFDLPIIYAAINGHNTRTLKKIADDIIVGGLKPWDIERQYKFKIPRNIDHIDLIEVAPGQASLKIYNGRAHGKRMQDLPIEPDAVLTDDEIDETYRYWKNDLAATQLLYEKLKPQIKLRVDMSNQYGIDLRSKSDAQIAEAVIKKGLMDIMGEVPKRPTIAVGTGFKYQIPDYIQFRHPALNRILDVIEDTTFRVAPAGNVAMPEELAEAEICIGDGVYRMGIGGLHSSESGVTHRSDDEYVLIDRDVASYYPRIIINQKLFPKHLTIKFLRVYRNIVDTRLKAKHEASSAKERAKILNDPDSIAAALGEAEHWGIIADSLKIVINGSFGKFGSKWSILYSPHLLIQTTITGQLSLLMLIDMLFSVGIQVVSANTDGIVIKCPRDRRHEMEAIVAKWEKITKFETEETVYSALYSRDVNSYIAVTDRGDVKTKGAFAISKSQDSPMLHINRTNDICVRAVIEFLTKNVPIRETIENCRDLREFVTVRTVQGGAIWGRPVMSRRVGKSGKVLSKQDVVGFEDGSEYLGKAIRFYYAKGLDTFIFYKKQNKSGNHNKVPKSEGAMPVMEMPDEFPTDIDYGWYIAEARSLLNDIGFYNDLV